MTEIETVTVTVEDLKANLDHYYRLMETKRLVITFEGKEVAAVGRWLPGEKGRGWSLRWHELLYEMYPEPIDPDDPELGTLGLEMARGYRPSSISILRP
jgi:hypothetical protein